MYLSKQKRMLLLDGEHASLIGAAIPHAFTLKNKIAVPHGVEETRVLRNLGHEAPSPILYQYDWPNSQGYTPYESQYKTSAFLTYYRNAFVLNDMGTGKTLAALWAMDFLMHQKVLDKVLIIAPRSTLTLVWASALWLNFPDLRYRVLQGSAARRKRLLAEDAQVYIINPEGISVIYDDLMLRPDITHTICDEIAEYANATRDKFKLLAALLRPKAKTAPLRSIWGLTGTPTPKAPTEAWAQCRLVCPENVSQFFGQFRRETMTKVTPFKWVEKPDANQRVIAAMQPSIRFTAEDVLDMPPEIHIDLGIEMSPEQTKAFKEMAKSLETEYANGLITAANQAVKVSKLVQIAGGVVYDKFGVAHTIPCADRLSTLTNCVRKSEGKAIVFVPYKSMLRMVADELSKNWKVRTVDGSTSDTERIVIFNAFQNTEDVDVLVAHPKCMAHGLTLTKASTIIYYAPYHNTRVCIQANKRIRRGGQLRSQVYLHLQGSEIERRIYQSIRNDVGNQDSLLALFSERRLGEVQ